MGRNTISVYFIIHINCYEIVETLQICIHIMERRCKLNHSTIGNCHFFSLQTQNFYAKHHCRDIIFQNSSSSKQESLIPATHKTLNGHFSEFVKILHSAYLLRKCMIINITIILYSLSRYKCLHTSYI